jgi:hypothetical protein
VRTEAGWSEAKSGAQMHQRHFERSEAIHSAAQQRKNGLLRFARNDGIQEGQFSWHSLTNK